MAVAVTERVTVLVSAREKAEFEAKAKSLGLKSVGELVRRSVKDYRSHEERDAEMLLEHPAVARLLQLLEESNRRAHEALDDAERELAATRAHFAARQRP
jgi:hypothetical protein